MMIVVRMSWLRFGLGGRVEECGMSRELSTFFPRSFGRCEGLHDCIEVYYSIIPLVYLNGMAFFHYSSVLFAH